MPVIGNAIGIPFNRRRGGAAFQGLLDIVPGAALANSYRLLSKDYSGNANEVRRSSDNDQQNIGFVDNSYDSPSLAFFVTNDGYEATRYDQSSNGRDLVMPTAANQLQIVDSGSEVKDNGFTVATNLRGSESYIETNQFTPLTGERYVVFAVIRISKIGLGRFIAFSDRNFIGSNNGYFLIGDEGSTSTGITNECTVNSYRVNGTIETPSNRGDIYDLLAVTSLQLAELDVTFNSDWASFGLNNYGGAFSENCELYCPEMVIYPHATINGNESNVRSNIANYYGITL